MYPIFWITGTHSSGMPAAVYFSTGSFTTFFSGRICGKKSTSWIEAWSVMNIVRRSMPMPMPEHDGMPYSSARTKSMSMNMASSSPFSLSRNCSWKRSSWSIGSLSSE